MEALFNLSNTKPELERGDHVLDFEEFSKFYSLLSERPEMSSIFDAYDANHNDFLQLSELVEFLRQEQKVSEDVLVSEVTRPTVFLSNLSQTAAR